MKTVFIALGLLLSQCLRAQSVSDIKKQIDKYSKKIERLIEATEVDLDSSYAANKRLLDYLAHVCQGNDALLHAKFPQKDDGALRVITSKDNQVRIYWWLLAGGGTQRCYNSMMQYKSNGKVYVKILSDESKIDSNDQRDCGAFYRSITSVKCKNGSTVYLLESVGIGSSALGANGIEAISIASGVNKVPFFKTPHSKLSEIWFEWDYSYSVNAGKERGDLGFKISRDKSLLYVPLIKDNNEITDKYLIYKFDGMQYAYDKKGK